MHVDYAITNCSHCGSNDIAKMGNENQIYGLVTVTAGHNTKPSVDLNTLLPVIATVCRNCGHVDLIHVNAKAIKN